MEELTHFRGVLLLSLKKTVSGCKLFLNKVLFFNIQERYVIEVQGPFYGAVSFCKYYWGTNPVPIFGVLAAKSVKWHSIKKKKADLGASKTSCPLLNRSLLHQGSRMQPGHQLPRSTEESGLLVWYECSGSCY